MKVACVMPCLNEELLLEETCAGLGFGPRTVEREKEAVLVLVDNGSTDGTLEVMQRVQRASRSGSVHVVIEPERGYVPARHAGNLVVRTLARDNAWDDVVVLQVDADTKYLPGYIEALVSAALASANCIVEAASVTEGTFAAAYPGFHTRARRLDERVLSDLPEENDLLVSDAVCAYRLDDYFRWGGHRRDFLHDGDEIHAETTRLYLRGRAHGAKLFHQRLPMALPSRRRVVARPVAYFASAGFPREQSWWRRWEQPPFNSLDLSYFEAPDEDLIRTLDSSRLAHLVALFCVLPLLVTGNRRESDNYALESLGVGADSASGSSNPAQIFEIIFGLLNTKQDLLITLLDHL